MRSVAVLIVLRSVWIAHVRRLSQAVERPADFSV
jgi:hypothetical protein